MFSDPSNPHTNPIPGYVYSGDVSPADYGGRWYGVTRDNCGHVIDVIGAGDLEDGDEHGGIIRSAHIYIRGHNQVRDALRSVGWDWRDGDRDARRAMILDAVYGYNGADSDEDFGGPYELRVTSDEDAIAQANRWAE